MMTRVVLAVPFVMALTADWITTSAEPILSEVFPNPSVIGYDSHHEYIELFNPSPSDLILTGFGYEICEVEVDGENCNTLIGSIPANHYFLLCRNIKNFFMASNCNQDINIKLRNWRGDTVILKKNGLTLDTVTYENAGSNRADQALRLEDNMVDWDWTTDLSPGYGTLPNTAKPFSLVINFDFEDESIAPWTSWGECSIEAIYDTDRGGKVGLVTGRVPGNSWMGISQDVLEIVESGMRINVSVWAKLEESAVLSAKFQLTLQTNNGEDSWQALIFDHDPVLTATWTQFTNEVLIEAPGPYQSAYLYAEGPQNGKLPRYRVP